MEKKIKVYNKTSYCIGVRTISGIEYNINPGSFVPLEQVDIEKLAADTSFFRTGALQVEESQATQVGVGIDPENAIFQEDEKLHLILTKKGPTANKELTALLEKATEPYMRQKIYDMAVALDLSGSKMKLIQEKIPELFMEV